MSLLTSDVCIIRSFRWRICSRRQSWSYYAQC